MDEGFCSIHDCKPGECFDIHYPPSQTKSESAEEMKTRIARLHETKRDSFS